MKKILILFCILIASLLSTFAEEQISFIKLKDAVEFIDSCLKNADHGRLSKACIDEESLPPFIQRYPHVFDMLREINSKTPLIELYSTTEFPKDKEKFELGGHASELGHIHIGFIKEDNRWYLKDIWQCL